MLCTRVSKRRSLRLGLGALAVLATTALLIPSAAQAGLPIPAGYEIAGDRALAKGVEHLTLARPGDAQRVNIARVTRQAPFALRTVTANDGVSPGAARERTSSICQRVKCLLAVNGDFWTPGTGQLIGGVISDGQLVKSPALNHSQIVISRDGTLTTGQLGWKGTLVPTDLRALPLAGVNVAPIRNRAVLYTPAFGSSTRTDKGATELVMRIVRPRGSVKLARTSVVRIVALHRGKGNAPIPADGAVLSAQGVRAKSLAHLWRRVKTGGASADALLRFESQPAAVESLGGSPMLVRAGKIVAPTDDTNFVRGRHPRTIVGRTKNGEALLVTVDGRQPGYSEGMTLAEAAKLMIDLGAVDAMNLDGGGSTTFVSKGTVTNRPSDRLVRTNGLDRILSMVAPGQQVLGNVERPVAAALALVPRAPSKDDGSSARAVVTLKDLGLPKTIALPVPQETDPASDPSGQLPALAYVPASTERNPLLPIAASLGIFALVTVALVDPKFRRRLIAFARAK